MKAPVKNIIGAILVICGMLTAKLWICVALILAGIMVMIANLETSKETK